MDVVNDGARRRLRAWAIASTVANAALIVTGGIVRLTKSGLGCPTWPKCNSTLFPDGSHGVQGAIEFGNRTLTLVLIALAVGTYLAARKLQRPRRRPAVIAALAIGVGIVLQAVIGGVSVLAGLNPWVVSLHLVVSLALVAAGCWLIHLTGTTPLAPVQPRVRALLWATVAAGYVSMGLGTVVTGAGPNSGDAGAMRNGIDLMAAARVHAAGTWVFVILTLVCLVALRSRLRVTVGLLLLLELVQGAIGYWQYFHGLQWQAVVGHMLGVALLSIAVPVLALQARARAAVPGRSPSEQEPAATLAQNSSGSMAAATKTSDR